MMEKENKHFIRGAKGKSGPFEPHEVIVRVEEGHVALSDEIFLPSTGEWKKLEDIPYLLDLVPAAPAEREYPELIEHEASDGLSRIRARFGSMAKKPKKTRYRRLKVALPVLYRRKKALLPEDQRFKKSCTNDMSYSGFSFDVYGDIFHPDAVLEIELTMPDCETPLCATVHVTRTSRSFEGRVIVGARFAHLSTEDRRRLAVFMREELASQLLASQDFDKKG